MLLLCVLGLSACRSGEPPPGITVAAAANLTGVIEEIGRAFSRDTGVPVTFSYGATALLAHQVANGAPFDVFAAADTRHAEQLAQQGIVERPAVFARGQLGLWAPRHPGVTTLKNLLTPGIRFIAIARPAAAPYGAAAVEALRQTGVWSDVERKIVYAGNINMAREYVRSGSADATLTAWSLILQEPGATLLDTGLHRPLDQAVAVVARSRRSEQARGFVAFMLGPAAQRIFSARGYEPARR